MSHRLQPALWLGLGALGALLARRLPAAGGDPLYSTLVALPAILGGFAALESWAMARGARRIAPRTTAVHAGLLVLVVLAALARPALGAVSPEILAAGLAALLLHRAWAVLLALRPLLGDAIPQRPDLAFFLLPLLVALALLPWTAANHEPDGDEPYYLLVTHSLAYDFDAELTNNYAHGDWRSFMDRPLAPQPGDPRGPHGEIYSRHNALLPLLLALPYRAAGKDGALAMMAALAAALAWTTLRLARHWFRKRPGEVLLAYGVMALLPPLLLYALQVWVEVPAALLATLALDRMLEPALDWTRKRWLGVGAPILLLPLLKIRFLALAAPLMLLAWLFAGRPRKPVLVLSAMLLTVGSAMLIYNQVEYHNPLKIHSWNEVALYQYSLGDFVRGGLGLFFDAGFGLLFCAPLWLLALPGLAQLLRQRHPLILALGVSSLPYLLLVVPRSEWYGGWCPPFRYGLILLPLLALALVPVLERRRRAAVRALLAALGIATVALALAWLAVPGWTYNFADGRTYLLDHLDQRFGADFARLFPSYIRVRTADWIWPALAVLAVPLCAWRRRGGRTSARLGLAAALLGCAFLPALARRLPTRTIEFEDPWVTKTGGHPEPDRWTFDRTRFRGSWVLREGESLRAPIVGGGTALELEIDLQFVRNHADDLGLEILAGERRLEVRQLDAPGTWTTLVLGPYEWPRGAPLVLRVPATRDPPTSPAAPNGVALDRARLRWR